MEQNRMISEIDLEELVLPQWQQEYACEVKLMDNQTLLQRTLWDAVGDDYDGCFTTKGLWKFKFLLEEVNVRLMNAGFINERVES